MAHGVPDSVLTCPKTALSNSEHVWWSARVGVSRRSWAPPESAKHRPKESESVHECSAKTITLPSSVQAG
eukprot:7078255-Alexandrium_andersonii.AAC.1